MTPSDQYANLRALAYGLEKVLGDAAKSVVAFKEFVRASSFQSDWGPITFRNTEPSISLPEERLVEWAREAMPHEVVEEKRREVPAYVEVTPATVRPSLRETLLGKGKKKGRFRIVGGEVVDYETGEFVEWATVVPAEPVPVFSADAESKERAEELVRERLAQLAAVVRPEVES